MTAVRRFARWCSVADSGRAWRLWWTRNQLALVGPPPQLSQRWLNELMIRARDETEMWWASHIGCTVIEVRYALAWLGLEAR